MQSFASSEIGEVFYMQTDKITKKAVKSTEKSPETL